MESVRRNLSASAPQYTSFRVSGGAPEPVRAAMLSSDTSATLQVEPLANAAGTYPGRRSPLAPTPACCLDEGNMLPASRATEAAGRQVYSAGSSSGSLDGGARFSLGQSGRMYRVI